MKKILLIVIPIIVLLTIVFIFVINPKLTYNKDISIIENKIKMVSDYLINNTGDIEIIKQELKNESVSSNRIEVEKEANNYLSSIMNNIGELKNIMDHQINYLFQDENIKDKLDNDLKFLREEKDKANIIKENINNIQEIDVVNIQDEDNKKILIDLFSNNFKIDNLDKRIDDTIQYIDYNISLFEYLNNNKNTWNYEDNKIVFNKRSNYEEYQKISNGSEFSLINDTTAPEIKAGDITITKGNSLNIKDKVTCTDSVDGKVDCKIEGSYDTNKVGSYTIKITATDKSENTITKNIKLNVKEKEVVKTTSNKPYYIEVIRNQNVVIVYGLDSNNKYTKIVKVFICSVGKSNSQTPTGTFKTQDKSSWGWLVGDLYGQYYTRITGSILFHSVPYTKKAKNTLEWDEYNKLGTPASKGCVRMTVRDVKWIYDNCPRGTSVKIYDGNLPSGVTKPSAPKIDGNSPNKGWDPTDPDKNNPWKK